MSDEEDYTNLVERIEGLEDELADINERLNELDGNDSEEETDDETDDKESE